MTALGMLVVGNAGAQVALARTNITVVGKLLPVVQALLRTALRAPSVAERAAGDGVLRRLCCRNEEVQLELLGTITPVEPGEERRRDEKGGEWWRKRKRKREQLRDFFSSSEEKKKVRRNRRTASPPSPFASQSHVSTPRMLRNRFRALQLRTGARARLAERRPDACCSFVFRRGVAVPRQHLRQGLFPSAARGIRPGHQWPAQAGAANPLRDSRELL